MTRQERYQEEVRQVARDTWELYHKLLRLKAEGDALDYGNTLVAIEGGPTKEAILAVPYATGTALTALMAAGHATNITKLL
jgi:hypothetical protein